LSPLSSPWHKQCLLSHPQAGFGSGQTSPLVKLQQTYDDNTTEKVEIPVIDGRSVEANLYGLNEFYEAAEELNYDTGGELFGFSVFYQGLSRRTGTIW
jgi:hypothetical protein